MSFLKQKISFSSNFAPLFGIMRHISSILLLAETLYTFSKSSLSKYTFGEISPEQSKVYLPWHWRVMQILKKNWLVVSNMTREAWRIFTQPLKSPKILLQWANFVQKRAKKIQRSYLSWHWTVMQNLNNPWPCGFKNGMWNWVNFGWIFFQLENFREIMCHDNEGCWKV